MDRALEHPEVFQGIAAWDEKMQSTLMYIEAIAPTSQTVLITGETGVGKELIAVAIHSLSHRQGEYVAVNIAGLDDSMFTDTLFGHIAGAYTGADKTRQGLIERAAGGTLFLDEIGDLSPASQIRLLRLLETREYYPLGSDLAKRTDARILVSTNKDLKQEMREGRFRRDLYYRLKTHPVHIPSLRERSADLPQLIDTFIRQAAEEFGREIPAVPPTLYVLLKSYHFPGNIRELKSLVFDAISRQTSKSLDLSVFEEAVGEKEGSRTSNGNGAYFSNTEKLPTIKQATDSLIAEALSRANGNQSQAARMLGISPQALSKRLKGPKD
ncbi:Transcriptional regulatory protein ZraR [subsurface metagenome]